MQLIWQSRGHLRVVDSRELPGRLLTIGVTALFSAAIFSLGLAFAHLDSGLVSAEELARSQGQQLAARARLEKQEQQLRAYAVRLSGLQAHIIRLNALGRQLTTAAGLDPRDFSFDEQPAQGGREPATVPDPGPEMAEFERSLASFAGVLQDRQTDLQRLSSLVIDSQSVRQARPDKHPVASGYISSYFGKRTDPLSGHSMHHKGLDYAAPRGSDVVAVADGIVTASRHFGGFGNFVEITHGHGLVTRYAHNKENLVRPGQRVQRGQVIALLGSTGRATGPNLHFEVLRDGKAVDPMAFIGGTSR